MSNNGSFTTNTQPDFSYVGEFYFVWSEKSKTTGKTTISWSLQTTGREGYDATSLVTTGNIYVNGVSVWTANNVLQTYSSNRADSKLGSGEFTIVHDTNGNGSFTVQIYLWKKYNAFASAKTYTETIDLDINYPYTNCTKPTEVAFDKTVLKPAEHKSVTLKWKKGGPGTANPVTGYKVWYNFNGGTWTEDSCDSNATSYTIDTSNVARGTVINACVRTIGTEANYDSGDAYVSNTAIINSLPPQPQFTATTTIVKSGEKATISLSADSSDGDGHGISILYKKEGDGSYTKYTSAFTWGPSENDLEETYYAITSDGYEESDVITITLIGSSGNFEISVNTSGSGLQSVNIPSKVTNSYVINPEISVSASGGGPYKKYWYRLEYSEDTDFTSHNFVELTTWTQSTTFKTNDIRQYLPSGLLKEKGYYYRIKVFAEDGVSGTIVKNGTTYYLTRQPKFLFTHNNSVSTNTDSEGQKLEGYYSKNLFAYFEFDQGYNCVRVSDSSSGSYQDSPYYDKWGNQNFGQVTHNKKTTLAQYIDLVRFGIRGQERYFYCAPSYWDESIKGYTYQSNRQDCGCFYRTQLPESKTLEWKETFYPLGMDSTSTISLGLNFYKSENLKLYGFDSGSPINKIKCRFNYSGVKGEYPSNNDDDEIKFEYSSSGSLRILPTVMQLYKALPSQMDRGYNGEYTTRFTVFLTNVFGEVLEYVKNTKQIDFKGKTTVIDEKICIQYYEQEYVKGSSGYWKTIYQKGAENTITSISQPLKENFKLRFLDITFRSYQAVSQASIEIYKNNTIFETVRLNFYKTSSKLEPECPYEYCAKGEIGGTECTLSEITEDVSNLQFRIKINSTREGVNEVTYPIFTTNLSLRRHVPSTFKVTKNSLNNDGTKVTIEALVSDFGLLYEGEGKDDNHATATLYYQTDNDKSGSINVSIEDGGANYTNLTKFGERFAEGIEIELLDDENNRISGFNYIIIWLDISTTQWVKFTKEGGTTTWHNSTSTKHSYSPKIILYSVSPTMSYRKNSIGINYDFPVVSEGSSNFEQFKKASLIVGAHDSSQYVVFKGVKLENNVPIDQISYFDIDNRTFGNIVVDCGDWD